MDIISRQTKVSDSLTFTAGNTRKLTQILSGMRALRHVAVHRKPLSLQEIGRFLHVAAKFTRALGDKQRAALLENAEIELERRVRAGEGKTTISMASLKSLRGKRAKVDQLEQVIKKKMTGKGPQRKAWFGSLWMRSSWLT